MKWPYYSFGDLGPEKPGLLVWLYKYTVLIYQHTEFQNDGTPQTSFKSPSCWVTADIRWQVSQLANKSATQQANQLTIQTATQLVR
jgi:hypothetical protein